MLIPRIVRGQADKVFAAVRNFQAATITDGSVLRWAVSGDVLTGFTRIPGVDVALSTAIVASVAGVAAVANSLTGHVSGEYGLCQIWGYHPNVLAVGATDAVNTVYTAGAAGAAAVRASGAVADIDDQELGVVITTGVANRSGVMIKCM